jgi:hypothetical protein
MQNDYNKKSADNNKPEIRVEVSASAKPGQIKRLNKYYNILSSNEYIQSRDNSEYMTTDES